MKKIVLPALLVAGSLVSLTAKAQPLTASNTLSVDLQAIVSVTIGTPAVTIQAFDNAASYVSGRSTPVENQLNVVASKAFTIKASAADLTTGTGQPNETIESEGINLLASDGDGTSPGASTYTARNLGNTAPGDVIISAPGGTPGFAFDVTYTLGGTGRTSYFLNKAVGTYTTTVTFTIVP